MERPRDVEDVDYWFIFELLNLLSPEYECYRNDWPDWVSRVRVSDAGIQMLSREHVKDMWSTNKLVCLDATGSKAMYERLFERPVVEYAPRVERPGKIFQVVGRLNGMAQTYVTVEEGAELRKAGVEMLESAKLIASQYDGRVVAVTFMKAKKAFQEAFGAHNVRHYGALRGLWCVARNERPGASRCADRVRGLLPADGGGVRHVRSPPPRTDGRLYGSFWGSSKEFVVL
jgi:hypothetical protein